MVAAASERHYLSRRRRRKKRASGAVPTTTAQDWLSAGYSLAVLPSEIAGEKLEIRRGSCAFAMGGLRDTSKNSLANVNVFGFGHGFLEAEGKDQYSNDLTTLKSVV